MKLTISNYIVKTTLTGICSVLPGLADNHELNRLRNWKAYRSLSNEEESALLRLCNLLDPDDLTGMTTLPQGRSKLHSSKEIQGLCPSKGVTKD